MARIQRSFNLFLILFLFWGCAGSGPDEPPNNVGTSGSPSSSSASLVPSPTPTPPPTSVSPAPSPAPIPESPSSVTPPEEVKTEPPASGTVAVYTVPAILLVSQQTTPLMTFCDGEKVHNEHLLLYVNGKQIAPTKTEDMVGNCGLWQSSSFIYGHIYRYDPIELVCGKNIFEFKVLTTGSFPIITLMRNKDVSVLYETTTVGDPTPYQFEGMESFTLYSITEGKTYSFTYPLTCP